jgi:hypothetical protein
MKFLLLLLALMAFPAFAAPTEVREWTSKAGTKLTGSALAMKAGKVQLKTQDRTIVVGLQQLSDDDQAYLTKHFGAEAMSAVATAKSSADELVTDGLPHPVGEVVGPIDAGDGATYFLYIPKTLRKGRLASLLHFNDAGGGDANSLSQLIAGAERNGWIVAANVESRNGPDHPVKNHEYAKQCVKHLTETLPIDRKRIYFTGRSGGGAMTFYNAAKLKSAGGIPQIGYIPPEVKVSNGAFFIISGTTDYNRYHSAAAAKSIGKDAIHRFFVGAHTGCPDWLMEEGIMWLNGKFLAKNKRSAAHANEALDYEAMMIDWIKKHAESEPHRAYYWAVFLKEDYGLSGTNAAALSAISSSLAQKPECVSYVQGIAAIAQFSEKYYCDVYQQTDASAIFGHVTPKLVSESEKLSAKFSGVPMIEEIVRELGQKTCSQ